jgi:hypothetical protein
MTRPTISVGVAVDRCRSKHGDQGHCSPVWRFVGHRFATNSFGFSFATRQTAVQFGGVFGKLLESSAVMFGPATMNLLIEC